MSKWHKKKWTVAVAVGSTTSAKRGIADVMTEERSAPYKVRNTIHREVSVSKDGRMWNRIHTQMRLRFNALKSIEFIRYY